MRLSVQQLLALISALAVFSYAAPTPAAAAETGSHVVSLSELHNDLNQARQSRAKNLADIERVLSLPAAQEALSKTRLNMTRVKAAIAELSDEELDRLAVQARAAEEDVEGGLVVGFLALIGLIVVVVVVLSVIQDDDE